MIHKTCPECDGFGEDESAWDEVCTRCEGSGTIEGEWVNGEWVEARSVPLRALQQGREA